jgi:hypothetical protein
MEVWGPCGVVANEHMAEGQQLPDITPLLDIND